MAGFGSLQEFNDSIKRNRDLLKANKKKPFDRESIYTVKEKPPLNDNKTLTDRERAELLRKVQSENQKEQKKQLILFFTSIAVALGLAILFLTIWKNW